MVRFTCLRLSVCDASSCCVLSEAYVCARMRGRMIADPELGFLAGIERQLSTTAQLVADWNIALPDEFRGRHGKAQQKL